MWFVCVALKNVLPVKMKQLAQIALMDIFGHLQSVLLALLAARPAYITGNALNVLTDIICSSINVCHVQAIA